MRNDSQFQNVNTTNFLFAQNKRLNVHYDGLQKGVLTILCYISSWALHFIVTFIANGVLLGSPNLKTVQNWCQDWNCYIGWTSGKFMFNIRLKILFLKLNVLKFSYKILSPLKVYCKISNFFLKSCNLTEQN